MRRPQRRREKDAPRKTRISELPRYSRGLEAWGGSRVPLQSPYASPRAIFFSATERRGSFLISYELASMSIHASAATVAVNRTAAPPVSVRKNSRSGVSRFRAHAVLPENAVELPLALSTVLNAFSHPRGERAPTARPSILRPLRRRSA